MPNIIPVTDLRNTNKVAEMCQASNEPIFITKNGYGTMVLMNMKKYEEEQEEKIILSRLVSAQNGKVIASDDVLKALKKKYDL